MEKRLIPGTDLAASIVGLGTWGLGGPNDVEGLQLGWSPIDDDVAIRTIHAALDAGMNFFDSSDFYGRGRSEELLGRALGARAGVLVATKVGIVARLKSGQLDPDRDFSAAHLRRSAEDSLRRLRRDVIDIYQLHGPGLDVCIDDEVWSTLEDLRRAGKIRHVGVSLKSSHMTAEGLASWLSVANVRTLQLEYSLANPAARAWLPSECGRGIIARSVLGHGLLVREPSASNEFTDSDHRKRKWTVERQRQLTALWAAIGAVDSRLELAVRFAVDAPRVTLALVGARSPKHVAAIAEALAAPRISSAVHASLERRLVGLAVT